MKPNCLFYLLLASLVLILCSPPALFAQKSDPEAFTLEEVTVTATKRPENLQKVPIAMDAISGAKLAETGQTDVDDILRNLPMVKINYQNDGMHVTLRGLGTDRPTRDNFPQESPMVGINVDGAYNTFGSAGENLFDVERMEVLYGPQSTLYASNSPGGIINIITNQPKLDKFGASASLELGSYSLVGSQGMLNVPIVNGKLGMRLAFQTKKQDPFNTVGQFSDQGTELFGTDAKNVRLKTLYEPTDKFSGTLTLNWAQESNSGRQSQYVQAFDKQDGDWWQFDHGTGLWTDAGHVTNPWTAQGGGVQGWSNGPNRGEQTLKGIKGDFKYSFNKADLQVVPSYSKTVSHDHSTEQLAGGWGPFAELYGLYQAHTAVNQKQTGVEARLTSKDDSKIKWVVGVNYYNMRREKQFTYDNYVAQPGHEDTSIADVYADIIHPLVWVHEEAKAAFANMTVPFTDKFRGNLGFRYSADTVENFGGPTEGYENVPPYKSPDYKVGVEYDLSPTSMVYANYATSYRVNYISIDIPPEKNKSYTLGSKNRFLDNRLQLNAAAYYYDYKNVFIDAAGLGTNGNYPLYENEIQDIYGNPVDLNKNGVIDVGVPIMTLWWDPGPPGIQDYWDLSQHGDFRTYGLDVTGEWLISERDRLNFGVTYLNSKWTHCRVVAFLKKLGGAALWPGDGANYDGQTRPNSPEWTISGTYEHDFELGNFGTLSPKIDAKYQSSYVVNLLAVNRVITYQEPHYELNADLQWTSPGGMWSLDAYVRNATDYALKTGGGDSDYLTLAPPRTYGVVASFKF